MKILVVGGGGREHTLVWKIKQSPLVEEIYCAPSNAGISQMATPVAIAADNVAELCKFALDNGIDLTVVGPEAPLAAGIVDIFETAGLRIFGPSQAAALIEGSKALSKEIMQKYGIPTAEYATFTEAAVACAYIRAKGAPIVVKADGLAAGKGVIVAMTEQEALAAVHEIMGDKLFGEAGSKIVIEEYLEGEEVSILAFSDGDCIVPMVSAQDHKRIFDGDLGLNTGGMGAYSPAPIYTPELAEFVQTHVLQPTIEGMKAEGRTYRGVLYAGLMVTTEGVKVLEYNARFGDPETQAVLMRLKTDLVEIMEAVIDHRLAEIQIEWLPEAAVCVVMAAGGYPEKYQKGAVINGLMQANQLATVFHAGTAIKDGQVVTAGGRVLGVTAKGADIKQAIDHAYAAVREISFQDAYYRRDIGYRALQPR